MIRLLTWCLAFLVAAIPSRSGLPESSPNDLGFDPVALAGVDAAVEHAIASGTIPGAVVIVGRGGEIALAKGYGLRAIEPDREPMTRDTIFDLASLTKPIVTATSILILVDRGRLRLDDRLGAVLPEFDNRGKAAITIEQLLRHRSGLIADNPIDDYHHGSEVAWKRLAELELVGPPGEQFVYSDVNYEILGRIVEKRSGGSLADFARKEIFDPLGMTDTAYLAVSPPADPGRVAPTDREAGRMLRGVVHDPRARALGGVAGHAGLFGTADDLALFARMILDEGRATDGRAILRPVTVRAMTASGDTPPNQKRGLGWDIDTPYSGPRGRAFGPSSFGHTGFTGTSLWIDPETRAFVILLTSRLHPDGKSRGPTALRGEIATIVGQAIRDRRTRRKPIDEEWPPAEGSR